MNFSRYACLLSVVAGSLVGVQPALSQGYPVRPIRMIVPFPPGAGIDVLARLIAPTLGERLGQNVVVDNRIGASGTIGAELAARSPPDGYTLLMISTSHAFNVSLFKKLAYDMVRDFAPVTQVATTPNVLVVSQSVRAASVKELVAFAKANPRQLNFTSAGIGTSSHLAGELFRYMAQVNIVHVPYKGAGAALAGLLGGEVQVAFFSIPSTLPHLKSGKVRVLAISTARRSEMLPDVPTVAEAGVAGYEASTWYGALTPARTPRSVVEQLNREIVQIMQTADMRRLLQGQGADPSPTTPEQFSAHLKSEIAKYARVAQAIGDRIE